MVPMPFLNKIFMNFYENSTCLHSQEEPIGRTQGGLLDDHCAQHGSCKGEGPAGVNAGTLSTEATAWKIRVEMMMEADSSLSCPQCLIFRTLCLG